MTGLPSRETAPNCSITCPIEAGRVLGELATQLTPPDEWLLNPVEVRETGGIFTSDAVRTVVQRNRLEDPSNPMYGVPQFVSADSGVLWLAQRRLLNPGEHLEPSHIEALQAAAERREQEREAFAALPEETRAQYTANAEPHLLKVAAELLGRDPEQAALDEMEALMREYASDDMWDAVGRGLHGKLDALDKIYHHDQAPFRIAAHALGNCEGSWLYVKRRFGGLGNPAVSQVCPNGLRDKLYFNAQFAHENARQEPGK